MSGEADYEKSLFLPDPHPPFHDPEAWATALAFARHFKPDRVFLLGDFLDFYQLSRFDRDPERVGHLQADLDCAHQLLKEVRKSAKDAPIQYLQGNHEDRLRRFLWTKAAELSGLRDLDIRRLLRLSDLGIRYVEEPFIRYRSCVVKHGDIVRLRSGYTATGELDRTGLSGVSGHTHRLGHIYRRNAAGAFTWLEAGCLCQLDPQHWARRPAVTDWMHGLAYGEFRKEGRRFVLHTLPIIKGRVNYGGKEIGA